MGVLYSKPKMSQQIQVRKLLTHYIVVLYQKGNAVLCDIILFVCII